MPDEARRLLEPVLRHPARRFDTRRCVLATERGEVVEDRPADDAALRRRDPMLAVDGEVGGRDFVPADARIESGRPARFHIPRHVGPRVAAGSKIAGV